MRERQSGQAMLESMVVVLIVCVFIFGLMQLSLIATTYMSGYDAVQAAIRSRIVNGEGENPEEISRWVGRVVLLGTQFKKLVLLGPGGIYPLVDFFYKDVITNKKDYGNKPIKIVTVKFTYLEKLIFAFLFRPANSSTQGTFFYDRDNTSSLPAFMNPRVTFSRMVISPDEKFYYKAYPGADND